MPRLPSAADVPNITPSGDSGVRAPAQAFESSLGIAAEELAPVAEKFAEVQIRQQTRRDAVASASLVNQHNLELDEEVRRRNVEEDFSDDEVLAGLGSFIEQRRQALLESFTGSEDSRARLAVRLQDVGDTAIGRAAGISVKLGRDKVDKAYNDRLAPLGERAAQDPTPENISRILGEVDIALGDLAGAFDPSEEEIQRKVGQEQVVLSAVDRLLIRDRVDEAESLLIDGGMNKFLSPEKQRGVRRSIETIRFNKEKEQRTVQSPIGRIRADEAAGIISSEDAQAAITKATFIARDRLNVPGEIVPATDLNPELPDDFNDVFLIKQPNGSLSVLKGANGIDGKVTFSRQEQSDGTVAVFQQTDNNPPEFVDLLRGEDNEPIKTGVSERGRAVGDRANVTAGLRERGLDIRENRLEQTISQNARTSEATLRDDFDKRVKPFREQARSIDQLEVALSGDISGLDNKIITNLVSRAIAPTNVRAQAELDSFKGFGDLGERLSGAVSTFFTGVRTKAQLDQIRTLISEMREKHIAPAMKEIEKGYAGVAIRSGLDPDNVVVNGKDIEIQTIDSQEQVDKLKKGTRFIWGPTNDELVKD